MARQRPKKVLTSADNLPSPPPPDEPPAPPPAETKPQPIVSWRFPTDRNTNVEVTIWPHTITLAHGESIEVFAVTAKRSYRDQDGNWQVNGSYRAHDLPILLHTLHKAYAWLIDQRDLNCPL